jgi:hypothetical protein
VALFFALFSAWKRVLVQIVEWQRLLETKTVRLSKIVEWLRPLETKTANDEIYAAELNEMNLMPKPIFHFNVLRGFLFYILDFFCSCRVFCSTRGYVVLLEVMLFYSRLCCFTRGYVVLLEVMLFYILEVILFYSRLCCFTRVFCSNRNFMFYSKFFVLLDFFVLLEFFTPGTLDIRHMYICKVFGR